MGIFSSSSPSSPISSPTASTNITDNMSSSPRQSGTFTRTSLSKSAVEIPKPRADEEPPEEFLGRLEEAVSKAEIANILAASGDSYYNQALQLYIDRFDFANDPLDIALRKLLMDVGLPKETQQIDRVMEAFAARYTKCNPDIFVSPDHPYILAFSLIMLHTDAFNKSNKRKMTKADYVKNTKLVGVSTDVLEYFFDNIVFAPFIFIEDPLDVNGQRGFTQDGRMQSLASGQMTPNPSGSGLSILGKSNKVDAYYLITRNLLGSLRVDVESHIPLRNPYSYQGTAGSWNEAELRRSFARADIIEIDAADTRRMSTLPFFSLNATGAPGPMLNNFAPPTSSDEDSVTSHISALRVTKVGLLNRKDDLLDGGKRASSRKWREWSIILTGSQLLFYRDSAVALNLVIQSQSPESEIFPTQPSYLRPDELLSVKDAIAVYDASYVKRDYVVRLVMPSGRHILLQTENEIQRNEWIAHINYASAFKTAGIRMRSVSAKEDARMDRSSYTSDAPQIPGGNDSSKLDSPVEDTRNNRLRISSDVAQDNYVSFSRVRSSSIEGPSSGQSRLRIVLSKIRDFESRIEAARTQLDSDIRLVHNLAILTSFQRSTRDRLQASVINLGRHIKQLRLEIVKATCFRDVLAADLASEEREHKIRKSEDMALAANRDHGRNNSVPTMVLSVHENDATPDACGRTSSRSDLSDLSHGQNDSSICESFHSALDFGSDWPRSIRITVGNQRNMASSRTLDPNSPLTTPSHEVPPGGFNGSSFFSSSSPLEPSSGRASFSSPSIGTDKSPVIASQISEEQAEEWDKTRAARRVSLVKVPATLKASNRDGRREASWVTENNDGSRISEDERRRSDESTRSNGLQPKQNT
ncbi:uncharacterized protein FOMMEDRAFT_19430 [Fomitiporia mediterranea MF3/22]|uniref:uncharacterized protein n=1 Tax=Fomitiporia mediterranea (strain MF3/22) TaxID=694068 RepID=UPI000440771D|nr:uncharacterized protein FOMMEDRAFT_19430 [Fomitiporia mediterranea MF3/22]EJD04146.1 hypothetical protein FOMMEDRAFT_19430 [Fomitiporia mediterranea MF3/22]